MSKKMMLLALALAAMFAIPSAASAQEIHLKGVTSFTGTGGTGALTANNEPKITCTKTTAAGSFDKESTTTGTVNLTFSGCKAKFLFVEGPCNTANDASETITSSGSFHLITFVNSKGEKKPAIMVTPVTTTIICVGFSRVEVTGPGVIGTILPVKAEEGSVCGRTVNTFNLTFEAEGSTQKHLEYTGTKYDLTAHTENEKETTGASGTAALEGTTTLSTTTPGTLECT